MPENVKVKSDVLGLKSILELPNVSDRVTALTKTTEDSRDVKKYRKEYAGKHIILDRPQKEIQDASGVKSFVDTAKIVITFQKKIVRMAVSFLFGQPVQLITKIPAVRQGLLRQIRESEKHKDAFSLVSNVWDANKLDYLNRKIARELFIETKIAELWYIQPTNEGNRIRAMLLFEGNGNKLYPHYDPSTGKMDAFTRKYEVVNPKNSDEKLVKADVYTDTTIYYYIQQGGQWIEDGTDTNPIKKIPIIYYEKGYPEWKDVQTSIDRMEMLVSKFADTNDYFGAPTVLFRGEFMENPKKDDVGRMVIAKGFEDDKGVTRYADKPIEYITWEHAPESIKMEWDMLKEVIYGMTSTPDISFNNVKGLGDVSGITLQLMFLDSIMKANENEEIIGTGIQRRLNLIQSILGNVTAVREKKYLDDLIIKPKFQNALPTHVKELIETLSIARAGEPTMSESTALEHNILVDDVEAEIEELANEANNRQTRSIAGSGNLPSDEE